MAADAAAAKGQGIGELHVIGAYLDTAPTHDALGVIPHVEGIVVHNLELAALSPGEVLYLGPVTPGISLNLRGLM